MTTTAPHRRRLPDPALTAQAEALNKLAARAEKRGQKEKARKLRQAARINELAAWGYRKYTYKCGCEAEGHNVASSCPQHGERPWGV